MLKIKLAVLTLPLDEFTMKWKWEGVTWPLTRGDFTIAFQRWFKRCKKCVHNGSLEAEKG
jgi:hypothetical protein